MSTPTVPRLPKASVGVKQKHSPWQMFSSKRELRMMFVSVSLCDILTDIVRPDDNREYALPKRKAQIADCKYPSNCPHSTSHNYNFLSRPFYSHYTTLFSFGISCVRAWSYHACWLWHFLSRVRSYHALVMWRA